MKLELPRTPSLEHLKKSAKLLLAAHRAGSPQCCHLLRQLPRLSGATDAEILASEVKLADVHHLAATLFGFGSWAALKHEIEGIPAGGEFSLDAVMARAEEEIPQYAGAGVPLGVVAALNYEGVDIGFMEFAAATGWAFSFGYSYDDISLAFMAVRGDPAANGPLEVFASVPPQYGFDYEMALTSEPEDLWGFVVTRVDAGVPVMSEHMDGGVITGYRGQGSERQIYFDGTVQPGWIDVDGLNPYAVYSLVRVRESEDPDTLFGAALRRAVAREREPEFAGVPQGLAALCAYRSDIADPGKDFEQCSEWICWAAFQRLMARRCAEVWLGRVAAIRGGSVSARLQAAADRYGEAFRSYDRFRDEVKSGESAGGCRTPDRIAGCVPFLDRGIAAEEAGLVELEAAIDLL